MSRRVAATAALLLAAGCGSDPQPLQSAAPFADPGMAEAGGFRMHYALTLTRDLPAVAASSYGIEPRRNLAVLTLVVQPRDARDAPPAAPRIEAEAISLLGVRSPLALMRQDDAGGATWIALVEVRHRVPVTIELRAHAAAGEPLLRARLTREFRIE